MSLEQAIVKAVRALPADKQREVLYHAAKLRIEEAGWKLPFRNLKGLWADLRVSISAEELDANQKEMWRDFPRGDV